MLYPHKGYKNKRQQQSTENIGQKQCNQMHTPHFPALFCGLKPIILIQWAI